MDIDPRLTWQKRLDHDRQPTALYLDGAMVAMLLDRVDGTWFARLDVQQPGVDRPLVTRDCSSYEAGRTGCELWAMRHLDRLLAEIADVRAKRPRHNGAR